MISKLLLIFLFMQVGRVYSQTDSLLINKQYISIAAEGFMRTSNHITHSGSRDILKHYNVPGVSLGLNYTRISKGGFTLLTGLHYQIIPVSYYFNLDYQEFDVPSSYNTRLISKGADYSLGKIYVPLYIGYTIKNERGGWEPMLMAGMNGYFFTSYQLIHGISVPDNGGELLPAFRFRVTSPHVNPKPRVWGTYNLSAKISRTVSKGNQIYAGLSANFSNLTVYNGEYYFTLKNGKETGTYTDKGNYIGLQFGYSFLRKPKDLHKNKSKRVLEGNN